MNSIGWHEQWEDEYSAQVYATFEELGRQFEMCEHELYSSMNVPVWLSYDEDGEDQGWGEPVLTVGVMLTRKGRTVQWIAPATPEQAQDIRTRMLRVWAGRADAMFDRYNARYSARTDAFA